MKEIIFIRNNIDKWQRTETMAGRLSELSPDDIADAYMDITADLAFAYTHYPKSRVALYLNNLASVLHNAIYRGKREKWSRVLTFWTREVPLVMYDARRLLSVSLLVFLASVLVGVVSQHFDTDFCRVVLGDKYVDMTLGNIASGKPMAVYDSGGETDMFLGITINNVGVAFRTFALGVLTSVATAWSLFCNGVMVGCFEMFFCQQGLLGESVLAVFLHGTLELTAIVVAGAAGLSLGNGWLFPGTYPRMVAFRRGARRGLKIVVGTVPVFVTAGFIEGFVTRHTDMHDAARVAIILLSLVFVIYYYVMLPRVINQKLTVYGKNAKRKD